VSLSHTAGWHQEMRSQRWAVVMKWVERKIVTLVAARQVDQLCKKVSAGDRIGGTLRWVHQGSQFGPLPSATPGTAVPHPQRQGHRASAPSRPSKPTAACSFQAHSPAISASRHLETAGQAAPVLAHRVSSAIHARTPATCPNRAGVRSTRVRGWGQTAPWPELAGSRPASIFDSSFVFAHSR